MKKVFFLILFVFLSSIAFAFVQGFEQDDKLSNKANRMLRTLHQRTWPFIAEIRTSKPTTDELPQGWASVTQDTSSGGKHWLNFNINGTIVKAVLVTDDTV